MLFVTAASAPCAWTQYLMTSFGAKRGFRVFEQRTGTLTIQLIFRGRSLRNWRQECLLDSLTDLRTRLRREVSDCSIER